MVEDHSASEYALPGLEELLFLEPLEFLQIPGDVKVLSDGSWEKCIGASLLNTAVHTLPLRGGVE